MPASQADSFCEQPSSLLSGRQQMSKVDSSSGHSVSVTADGVGYTPGIRYHQFDLLGDVQAYYEGYLKKLDALKLSEGAPSGVSHPKLLGVLENDFWCWQVRERR